MAHRARLDSNQELLKFSLLLEEATIQTVEAGFMTKDLALLATGRNDVKDGIDYLNTESFMNKIDEHFKPKWEKYYG